MNVKKDIRFRVYVAFTCVCLLGVAIIVKAAMVQVKEGPELRALAKEMRTHNTVLPAERGNIYTEDGLLLCSSIPQFNLHVDFSVIKQDTFYRYVDSLAGCLSGLFKVVDRIYQVRGAALRLLTSKSSQQPSKGKRNTTP